MNPDPGVRPMTATYSLRLHCEYLQSSFSGYLHRYYPDLLPGNYFDGVNKMHRVGTASKDIAPHGTTIVAITYHGGVLIAGDRRGTMDNLLASRDMDKVFIADTYSAAGYSGTVGLAGEMIRLFAVELEHYEKIEGVPLTFDGKATKLSTMVRDNLAAAVQGMAVVPILVGYDPEAPDPDKAGRIVSYDVVGGRSEERFGYAAVGSGSMFAKSSLKKTYRRGIDEEQALRIAVESLFDAADDDTATGGPDLVRGIYPTAVAINGEGALEISASRLAEIARGVVENS